MIDYLYEYAVLRYIHDPSTQEFINVGVVVYAPESPFVKALVNPNYSRLSEAFAGDVNGEHYRRVVNGIATAVNQWDIDLRHPRFPLKEFQPPANLESLLRHVLPPDDSSLVFAVVGGGITYDLESETERLFQRIVMKYVEQQQSHRVTEDEVWQDFVRELVRLTLHHILRDLETKTINISESMAYTFEHAWKNERWHAVQPVSLDLTTKINIQRKAWQWMGLASTLKKSDELASLSLILAAPRNRDLRKAYEDIVNTMRSHEPTILKIIEQKDFPDFSRVLAKDIKEHKQ